MHWLIDGYNLIRQVEFLQAEEHDRGLAAGREALLKFLADFARCRVKGKGKVTVVFDGPAVEPAAHFRASPTGHFPHFSPAHPGVEAVFSRGQTADQVIEELIIENRNPADITVVSADGEVKRFARRHCCSTLDPAGFIEKALAPDRQPKTKPSLHPDRQHQLESELRKHWIEK